MFGKPIGSTGAAKSLAIALIVVSLGMARPALAQMTPMPAPMMEQGELPSLAPMLETVIPGVVSIAVQGTVALPQNPLLSDPFFRQFFGAPDTLPPTEQTFQAAGSGVIIDAGTGRVLTNAHVIANADRITVRLSDGRELPARVLGTDTETDIAALEIEADALTALRIGRSDALRVGDYVVAVGNPFGLEQTVTSGIISALGRANLGIEGYENFIQIDASINPGNSGGALVNLRGELVGINTAILGPSGGSVGIGFAIPIDMAMNVADQLVAFGAMRRGQIGVLVQDLTPALAKALAVAGRGGAVISDVIAGSAAQAAGLQPGDVIIAVDGIAVSSSANLRNRLGILPAGTQVMLSLVRAGEPLEIDVTLSGKDRPSGVSGKAADAPETETGLQGVTLRATDTGAGRDGQSPGVLVVSVAPNSASDLAGLRAGDVIAAANRTNVRTPEDVARIAASGDGPLLLRVFRQGAALFLVIG